MNFNCLKKANEAASYKLIIYQASLNQRDQRIIISNNSSRRNELSGFVQCSCEHHYQTTAKGFSQWKISIKQSQENLYLRLCFDSDRDRM
jgi:hypothetical protein